MSNPNSTPPTKQELKVDLIINITSYATNLASLATWMYVLVRIIVLKTKLFALVVICDLMIVFQVAVMILY